MSFSHKKNIVVLLLIFCATTFISHAQTKNDGSRYAKSSVLATDNWTKVKVKETGFYKITYDQLKNMGLSDPAKVKVYGYGGNLLDEDFSTPYVDDLPEVAIWMEKGTDGVFNSGDYILFYAKGSIKWEYNKRQNTFEHENNPYSDEAYFFITEGDNGKRSQEIESAASSEQTVNWFNDYFLHEKDEKNLLQSGREFYGESFRVNNEQSFTFNIPGIIEGETATLNFVAKTSETTPVSLSINGTQILKGNVPSTSGHYQAAGEANITEDWNTSNTSEQNKVTVKYDGVNHENSHLNYIRLTAKRRLQSYGSTTLFRNTTSLKASLKYTIENASNSMRIFDVTDEGNIKTVKAQLSGSTLEFAAEKNGLLTEYALVDLSKTFPSPEIIGKVDNQDLHNLPRADMVILVQPVLQKYAEQLAQLHHRQSGLTTHVINPEKIYNEFSSGKPDATAIRRFMKMFYDRATNESEKPRYLLFFGDGVHDNKFIEKKWKNVNKSAFLLTYQTRASLSETGGSPSNVIEDYFGFLDDNSGKDERNFGNYKLDLGIGRLPVRNREQAQDALNKIAAYMADKNFGIWKNSITFLADDAHAENNSIYSEKAHMEDSNILAKKVERSHPEFIVNRIFMDAFERKSSPQGHRYPDAQRAFFNAINEGQLVLNYMGHGSTRDWAHEYILTLSDIENMVNDKQALWITATCDFGRFDAERTSGAEAAFLNPRGGAIALFSTTRVVYASYNMQLATEIFNHIFSKHPNGEPLRLGDILRNAKSKLSNDNKLSFVLFGDPALRLAYAKEAEIKVTQINGKDVTGDPIQIKALSEVTIKGRIVKDNNTVSDFQGMLATKIFDSRQTLNTRGNNDEGYTMEYQDYLNTVFSGNTEVKNGEFELTFIAPKDILYSDDFGKMSFYAHETDGTRQAQGVFTNYKVYGTSNEATQDNEPPVIEKIYLNNESFVNGSETNTSPHFVAMVSDDSGINLSGSVGHEITISISGVNHLYQKTYNLTNNFKTRGDAANAGNVEFLIPELEPGDYKLTFKIWDVHNNSATQELAFTVSERYQPEINEFFVYGNPAKEATRFIVKTNTPGAKLVVNFSVYTTNGELVFVHQEATSGNTALQQIEYTWNLVGNNGMRLAPGLYICRASISSDDKTESMKAQKLVVTTQ